MQSHEGDAALRASVQKLLDEDMVMKHEFDKLKLNLMNYNAELKSIVGVLWGKLKEQESIHSTTKDRVDRLEIAVTALIKSTRLQQTLIDKLYSDSHLRQDLPDSNDPILDFTNAGTGSS